MTSLIYRMIVAAFRQQTRSRPGLLAEFRPKCDQTLRLGVDAFREAVSFPSQQTRSGFNFS